MFPPFLRRKGRWWFCHRGTVGPAFYCGFRWDLHPLVTHAPQFRFASISAGLPIEKDNQIYTILMAAQHICIYYTVATGVWIYSPQIRLSVSLLWVTSHVGTFSIRSLWSSIFSVFGPGQWRCGLLWSCPILSYNRDHLAAVVLPPWPHLCATFNWYTAFTYV